MNQFILSLSRYLSMIITGKLVRMVFLQKEIEALHLDKKIAVLSATAVILNQGNASH